MTWRILIPLETPSQNTTERGHNWRARAHATKERRTMWRMFCIGQMAHHGVPPAKGKRSMHILSYRKRRCADIANLIGGAKACVDGLADAGLVTDDRDSKARITYAQEVASKSPNKQPCTIIEIEDI